MASFVEELMGAGSDTTSSQPEPDVPAQQDGAASAEPESQDAAAPEPEAQDQAGDGSPESTATEGEGANPELEAYAADLGFDLNDARQRELAQKAFAREQQGKTAGQAAEPVDTLTEFERSLYGQAEEDPPQPEQTTPQQQAVPQQQVQQPQAFQDAGSNWRTPLDAMHDEMQAWTEITQALSEGKPADFTKVYEIKQAQFVRELGRVLPAIERHFQEQAEKIADQRLQTALGDVLPEVRESVEAKRLSKAKELAIADLSKVKGFEKVAELYKPEPGHLEFVDPITKERIPAENTPLNRIFAQNPEILNIDVTHDAQGRPLSPEKAMRATITARLKAAMRYLNAQRISPQTAQTLISAGQKVQQRRQMDRVRQGLNAGSGVSNQGNGAGGQNFVEGLLNVPGEGLPFSSLFK